MSELKELRNLLESHGMTLVGIILQKGAWVIYAHNPGLVGKKPKLEECRDAQDYMLLLEQWKQHGEFVVFAAEEFNDAVLGAIESVKGY